MSDQNDHSEDFDFSRTPGLCWVCEAPIDSGLFCSDHDGSNLKKSPDQVKVQDLKPGHSGFVFRFAMYTENDNYFIFLDALVKPESDKDYSLKIRRTEDGQLRLDIQSIGTVPIFEGKPEYSVSPTNRIFLENKSLISNNDFSPTFGFQNSPVITTTVNNMDEWQIGYTVPSAFIVCDNLLWVRKDSTVISVPEGDNTVKIRKNATLIEVDHRTLSFENIKVDSWPENEPFENYIMAIPLNSLP